MVPPMLPPDFCDGHAKAGAAVGGPGADFLLAEGSQSRPGIHRSADAGVGADKRDLHRVPFTGQLGAFQRDAAIVLVVDGVAEDVHQKRRLTCSGLPISLRAPPPWVCAGCGCRAPPPVFPARCRSRPAAAAGQGHLSRTISPVPACPCQHFVHQLQMDASDLAAALGLPSGVLRVMVADLHRGCR